MTGNDDRTTMCERWVDEVTCVGCDPQKTSLICNALFSSLPDIHHVVDLPKTDNERSLIIETVAAANDLLPKLGLPDSPISEARIHILADDEFDAKFGHRCRGKCAYSHVYLRRQTDLVDFAHKLTHELAHLLSFLAIEVTAATQSDDSRDLQILPRRSGLSLYGLEPAMDDPLFNGLNEAMTEIVAHDLRLGLAEHSQILSPDDLRLLAKSWLYLPQIKIVLYLRNQLLEADPDSNPQRELHQDYLAGTSRFLNRLYAHNRPALLLLRTMGTKPDEAFRAADALGCPEIMDDIRHFYDQEPDPQPPK
ncbi:MAG: hypothetical protein WCT10_05255 [Patescibacteria group bacterium]|jgi:hypothetical protein